MLFYELILIKGIMHIGADKKKGWRVMNANVKEFVAGKVKEMVEATTCSKEAKTAGQNWLEAEGTDREVEATKKLIAELELDIMPVDNLLAFAGSEDGLRIFGKDMAKKIVDHATGLRDGGIKYCDCPACAAAEAILEKKGEF